jgi:two-component system OmpR family response regulator
MQALRVLRGEQRIDLAVIDVDTLPMMSGYDLLERMRASGLTTPVIVLTARQERDDPRTSFGLGADDFVRKPFGIEELALRVAAILRRSAAQQGSARTVIGSITIDDDAHEVRRGDEVVEGLPPPSTGCCRCWLPASGEVLSPRATAGSGLGPGTGDGVHRGGDDACYLPALEGSGRT